MEGTTPVEVESTQLVIIKNLLKKEERIETLEDLNLRRGSFGNFVDSHSTKTLEEHEAYLIGGRFITGQKLVDAISKFNFKITVETIQRAKCRLLEEDEESEKAKKELAKELVFNIKKTETALAILSQKKVRPVKYEENLNVIQTFLESKNYQITKTIDGLIRWSEKIVKLIYKLFENKKTWTNKDRELFNLLQDLLEPIQVGLKINLITYIRQLESSCSIPNVELECSGSTPNIQNKRKNKVVMNSYFENVLRRKKEQLEQLRILFPWTEK